VIQIRVNNRLSGDVVGYLVVEFVFEMFQLVSETVNERCAVRQRVSLELTKLLSAARDGVDSALSVCSRPAGG